MKYQQFWLKPFEESPFSKVEDWAGWIGSLYQKLSAPDRNLRCLFDLPKQPAEHMEFLSISRRMSAAHETVIVKTEIKKEKGQVKAQSFGRLHSLHYLPGSHMHHTEKNENPG